MSSKLESTFKTKLVNELYEMFPGCIITHLDPLDTQGLPDLIILYKNKWAVLEGKRNKFASSRPNQPYPEAWFFQPSRRSP